MFLVRKAALVCALGALAACSPHLDGLCQKDADCRSGETCSSDGLCLRSAAVPPGPGGSDAGNGGNPNGSPDAGNLLPDGGTADGAPDAGSNQAALNLDSPGAGSYQPGTFPAHATANPAIPFDSVSFTLLDARTNAALSNTAAAVSSGNVWTATLIASAGFNGIANLQAVARRAGASDLTVRNSVIIDQTPPSIDGGNYAPAWVARAATLTVSAGVQDTGSGVAAASLALDGGVQSYVGVIDGGIATFTIPAADVVAQGGATTRGFVLAATDNVGNAAQLAAANQVFEVDDAPPTVSLGGLDSTTWRNSTVDISAIISDQGSGLASATLSIGSNTLAPLSSSAANYTFRVDVAKLFPQTEAAVPFQVLAADNVANAADAGNLIQVDTVPPALADVVPATTADYLDGGVAWFSTDGGAVTATVAVDGGAGSPIDFTTVSATVGGQDAGVSAPNRVFTLSVPRSAFANTEGAQVAVTHVADAAHNQGTGGGALYFDGVPPSLGAALTSPAGWVARSDATGPHLIVVSGSVTDRGSGVAGATWSGGSFSVANGAFSATIGATQFSAPGQEGAVNFTVGATDHVLNASSQTYQILVDDKAPGFVLDPGDSNTASWHSSRNRNLTFTAAALVNDAGSGVAGSTLQGIAGSNTAGSQWTFPAVSIPAGTENDSWAVAFTAVDKVGNTRQGSVTFKVDDVAPQISNATVDSAPDGNGYFAGPNVAANQTGMSPTIAVSANIADKYLDGSTVQASVGSTVVAGSFNTTTGKWTFQMPRAIGANAAGPVTVNIDARDKAGNPAVTAQVAVNFDDLTSFPPQVAADNGWYARTDAAGKTVSLSIPITFAATPASGIKSVVLRCGAIADAPAVLANGSWTAQLSSSCIPPGWEAPITFTVTALSNVGQQSSSSPQRNFDDAPPVVVGTPAINYPAAPSGTGLAYSRDGSHYNIRDTVTVVMTFADCGAGLDASAVTSFAVAGNPATRGATVSFPGDTYSCNTNQTVPVAHVTITADLTTAARSAFPQIDNTAAVQATVHDKALATHTTSQGANVNVTRRLWATTIANTSQLTLGPVLYASGSGGLYAIKKDDGTAAQQAAASSLRPAVAPNGSAPLVFWTNGSALYGSPSSWPVQATQSCALRGTDNVASGFTLIDGATAAVGSTTTTTTQTCSCPASCQKAGTCGDPNYPNCTVCTNHTSVANYTDSMSGAAGTCGQLTPGLGSPAAVGRSNDLFTSGSGKLTEINLSSGTSASVAFSPHALLVTDNGSGADAVIATNTSGASRWDFSGGAFSAATSIPLATLLASVPAPNLPLLLGLNSSGALAAVDLGGASHGATASGIASNAAAAVDGARTAFVAGGNGVNTVVSYAIDPVNGVTPGPFPQWAPSSASVDDLVLGADGTLYVIAGGVIYAVQTDSPGLGTAAGGANASAWPIAGRDACRSSNLSVNCPW